MVTSPVFSQLLLLGTFFFLRLCTALSTDSIMDADLPQSGYLPNHNMDPAVVGSNTFGQVWKKTFNSKELFYAKPLVYTPPSTGKTLVFLASSQNIIRILDANTGATVQQRTLNTPYLAQDVQCTDNPDTTGITGTPIIDPATDTVYFYVKSYIPNYRTSGNTGVLNGVYYFYAVDIKTLADRSGFPMLMEGTVMQNDNKRVFQGGITNQRSSLTMVNGKVYAAFSSHCDNNNYTGFVIGIDPAAKKVVGAFATESGSQTQHGAWNVRGGGGMAGIWMSGMGMAVDGNRLFLVTGNGNGHLNQNNAANGKSGLAALDECAVNLAISGSGSLSLTDYFQPFDYLQLDSGDRDFGSGGFTLLDSSVFSGGGVNKIGVAAGKSGKIYVMNLDNLGGYKNGAGGGDGVLQTLPSNGAIFGGMGSYPLEGGYVYAAPIGGPVYVYKMGKSSNGQPALTQVGKTQESSAGNIGVGIPTITSLNGKAGTGILWLTDPSSGLRAWHAVPGSDGYLTRINLPQTGAAWKFQRPAFGNGRVFVTDRDANVYCLGAPVNLPLTCTEPVDFGDVTLGTAVTKTVSCKANIAITSIQGATVGDKSWTVSNSSFPKGSISAGTTFTFPVTWNLTAAAIAGTVGSSASAVTPGQKSTPLTIALTPATSGYPNSQPIGLTGNEISQKPFLIVNPGVVDFGGIVIPKTGAPPTVSASFVVSNVGRQAMKILGIAFTKSLDKPAWTNATNGNLGVGFKTSNLPSIGSSIAASSSVTVTVTFNATTGAGAYGSIVEFWTDGGNEYTILSGTAGASPKLELTLPDTNGNYGAVVNTLTPKMDFGKVTRGQSKTLNIRVCNTGGGPLTITKSKPPGSDPQLAGTNSADLHEGQIIAVGQCAYGGVKFAPATATPVGRVIQDSWTLNGDDLSFGVHVISVLGTVA